MRTMSLRASGVNSLSSMHCWVSGHQVDGIRYDVPDRPSDNLDEVESASSEGGDLIRPKEIEDVGLNGLPMLGTEGLRNSDRAGAVAGDFYIIIKTPVKLQFSSAITIYSWFLSQGSIITGFP